MNYKKAIPYLFSQLLIRVFVVLCLYWGWSVGGEDEPLDLFTLLMGGLAWGTGGYVAHIMEQKDGGD